MGVVSYLLYTLDRSMRLLQVGAVDTTEIGIDGRAAPLIVYRGYMQPD